MAFTQQDIPAAMQDIAEDNLGHSYLPANGSVRCPSRSSTENYDQEPFETYQEMVLDIALSVFPQSARLPVLQRLPGGNFNRITSVTIEVPEGPKEYIFRSSRFKMPVDKSAATLHYLEAQPHIPTPKIAAERKFATGLPEPGTNGSASLVTATLTDHDDTYIMMEKLEGVSLHQVYYSFTQPQKVEMARTFATLMADIFDLPRPGPDTIGSLEAAEDGRLAVTSFLGEHARTSPRQISCLPPSKEEYASQTQPDAVEWLFSLLKFGERAAVAEETHIMYYSKLYQKVSEAVQLLLGPYQEELNTTASIVFSHNDLASRNVLVIQPTASTGPWSISGVLDWDECFALPAVAAFWSPNWLWLERAEDQVVDGEHWEFDADPDQEPSNPECQAIKAAFVETIEARFPRYMRVVSIGHKAKIKQLLYLAQHGLCTPGVEFYSDIIFDAAGLAPGIAGITSPTCNSSIDLTESIASDEVSDSDDADECEASSISSEIVHTAASVVSLVTPNNSAEEEAVVKPALPLSPGRAERSNTPQDAGEVAVPEEGALQASLSESTATQADHSQEPMKVISDPGKTSHDVSEVIVPVEEILKPSLTESAATQANLHSRTPPAEAARIATEAEAEGMRQDTLERPVSGLSKEEAVPSGHTEEKASRLAQCFTTIRAVVVRLQARRREKVLKRRQKAKAVVKAAAGAFRVIVN